MLTTFAQALLWILIDNLITDNLATKFLKFFMMTLQNLIVIMVCMIEQGSGLRFAISSYMHHAAHTPTERSEDFLTIGVLYTGEDGLFMQQMAVLDAYDEVTKNKIVLVVVDDVSDLANSSSSVGDLVHQHLQVKKKEKLSFRMLHYTMSPFICYNMPGKWNLVFHVAPSEYVLRLDIDVTVPQQAMTEILALAEDREKRSYHKFPRRSEDTIHKNNTIHPGIVLTSQTVWWGSGGCDEDFAGHYGYDDIQFQSRARDHGYKEKIHPGITLLQQNHNLNLDKFQLPCNRETAHNKHLLNKKMSKGNWSTDFLRFNWSLVSAINDAPLIAQRGSRQLYTMT